MDRVTDNYEMSSTSNTNPVLLLNFYKFDSSNIFTESRKIPFDLEGLNWDEPGWKLAINLYGYEENSTSIDLSVSWHYSSYVNTDGTNTASSTSNNGDSMEFDISTE